MYNKRCKNKRLSLYLKSQSWHQRRMAFLYKIVLTSCCCFFLINDVCSFVNPNGPPTFFRNQTNKDWIHVNSSEQFELRCRHAEPVMFWKKESCFQDSCSSSRMSLKSWLLVGTRNQRVTVLRFPSSKVYDSGMYYCSNVQVRQRHELEVRSDADSLYVFVTDPKYPVQPRSPDSLSLKASYGDSVYIPCLPTDPTEPNDKVIIKKDNKQITNFKFVQTKGFHIPYAKDTDSGTYHCSTPTGNGNKYAFTLTILKPEDEEKLPPPVPIIEGGMENISLGDRLNLRCEVPSVDSLGTSPTLSWIDTDIKDASIDKNMLEVASVTKEHERSYNCKAENHVLSKTTNIYIELFESRNFNLMLIPEKSNMNISFQQWMNTQDKLETLSVWVKGPMIWKFTLTSNPDPEIIWMGPLGEEIRPNRNKSIAIDRVNNKLTLQMSNLTLSDRGNYSINIYTRFQHESYEYTLVAFGVNKTRLEGKGSAPRFYFGYNVTRNEPCIVYGLNPSITWSIEIMGSSQKVIPQRTMDCGRQCRLSLLSYTPITSGKITCHAQERLMNDTLEYSYIITDLPEEVAFYLNETQTGVREPKIQAVKGRYVSLLCGGIKSEYSDVAWVLPDPLPKGVVSRNLSTSISYQHWLIFQNAQEYNNQLYKCNFQKLTSSAETKSVQLIVKPAIPPQFLISSKENIVYLDLNRENKINCSYKGYPPPTITWKMNQVDVVELMKNNSRLSFKSFDGFPQSILYIKNATVEDEGVYTCFITSSEGEDTRTVNLQKPEDSSKTAIIVSVVVVVIGIVVAIVAILAYRSFSEEKELEGAKNQLNAIMAVFQEGELQNINPELSLMDQADSLPYSSMMEFPREKLKLGREIGSGEFGKVLLADAEMILRNEAVSTVAVKMVKHSADMRHLRALISELKIMIHLGKHLNVLNVLGACTTKLMNGELLVIFEYCCHGNLLHYIQRHIDEFVDQVNPETGAINRKKTLVGSITTPENSLNQNDSGVGTGGTSYDDATAVKKAGEAIYVPCPEDPRTNIQFSTSTLLCWAFQACRGMEYMASRKIMHGDLAARNILLARDNVIKIADFGLSRDIYKQEQYKKKTQTPLPLKWMAIESIQSRIFSIQSDVWSFGIVLWELFSLGQMPYPGIFNEKLLGKLLEGHRMTQPGFATSDLYKMMLHCWKPKPAQRPTFRELVERIGEMLEDNVKEYYLELNQPYIKLNEEFFHSHPDYIDMTRGKVSSVTHRQASQMNPYVSLPNDAPPATLQGYLDMNKHNNKIAGKTPEDTNM